MDIQIISFAVVSFLLFLIVLVVLFRITRQEAAIVWIIRSFFGVGAVVACFRYGVWSVSDVAWWAVLYSELAILFVFGVFSIMEASVTLAIFSRIAKNQKLLTKKDIVQKRINRLLYSGELVGSHGRYALGRTSYFRIREVFLEFFRKLFP